MRKSNLSTSHEDLLKKMEINSNELSSLFVLNYLPGETIYQEGYPITWLGIVLRGKAKVCCSSPNGNHLVLCYFVSSGIIGGIEMMSNTPNATASLIALTEFECIAIPFDSNIHVLKQSLIFIEQLCSQLSVNLVRSSSNFVSSSLYTGKQRLCSYILESSHKGIFSDVLTDVASSIGLSYRHMLRILSELCHEKILIKKENGYLINDLKQLKQNAIHSPNIQHT